MEYIKLDLLADWVGQWVWGVSGVVWGLFRGCQPDSVWWCVWRMSSYYPTNFINTTNSINTTNPTNPTNSDNLCMWNLIICKVYIRKLAVPVEFWKVSKRPSRTGMGAQTSTVVFSFFEAAQCAQCAHGAHIQRRDECAEKSKYAKDIWTPDGININDVHILSVWSGLSHWGKRSRAPSIGEDKGQTLWRRGRKENKPLGFGMPHLIREGSKWAEFSDKLLRGGGHFQSKFCLLIFICVLHIVCLSSISSTYPVQLVGWSSH